MTKAKESLKLAKSYLDEVEEKFDLLESGAKIEEFARMLDLALEQINLTEENDPTVSCGDYDLNEAKLNYNYFKGSIEYFKKNYDEAISYLRQVLKIDPDFNFAYAALSDCYWNIGNKEDALKNIKCAVELKPENIEYKKIFNRMISAGETTLSSFSDEEIEKRKLARKSIYISIVWAVLGSICALFYLKSEPGESPLLIAGWAYVFWATYWGWRLLHGLSKRIVSGVTSMGCLLIMPLMQWIIIGTYYIGIMIPVSAVFGSLGGGVAAFLVHLKRARMSSKALGISFASLLFFVFTLGLLTFKSQRGKIDFERPAYYKEKQSSISEKKIQESKPLPLHREQAASITDQNIAVTPSIPLPGLIEAKQRIPDILERIYQDFDQGNSRAASSFVSPEILSNSTMLDTICKPFTYRAHYIENIIERPKNKFEARVRVLFQSVEEGALILTFGVENNSFVLESISSYLEDWFSTWKEEAIEVSRNFYYALKADRHDILNKLLSSSNVLNPEFTSSFSLRVYPVKSYSEFQNKIGSLGAINSINAKIIPYKGLKALVHFSCGSPGMAKTWDIYVDNIDGEYKIVKWQYEDWAWGAHGSDPNIELCTLKRFESRKELSAFQMDATVSEKEIQKSIDETPAVLSEKEKQELNERNKIFAETDRKKFEEEQKIKTDEEREVKKPVRAIGEIKPPKPVKKVEPIYPETAIKAKVEGVVILEVTTDIYGRVENIKILRSISLLDQAAIDAVRQWLYEPVFIDDKPRGVIFTQTVFFKLGMYP